MNIKQTAVTHDGVFHSDDVFAAAALQLAFPGIEIKRSRDPKVLELADIRFDVGGESNGCNFDHHQRGGAGERPNGVPYASFGLVWKAFGNGICESAQIAHEVDRTLVQSVDAHDNGYLIASPIVDAIQCTISHVISNFNPSYDEENQDTTNIFFTQALPFARTVLERAIARARGKVQAHSIVKDAIEWGDDEEIVAINVYVPWQEALIEASDEVLYIVYPSAGTWRVQAVPVVAGQPAARKLLPATWAGLDGEALARQTGVADATFAHRGRFIAGAQTKDGALQLARLAVNA